MSDDPDSFYEGLLTQALASLKDCTQQLRDEQLRAKNLQREIAAFPATCWELRERVTALEILLAARPLTQGESTDAPLQSPPESGKPNEMKGERP